MMTRPKNWKYLSYFLAATASFNPSLVHSHFLDLFDKGDPSARISVKTEGDLAKKSGETAHFTGSVELIDAKGRGESCSSFLKRKGLKIRAFFPDATTEVTSKLVLSSSGQKISFRYDTPALAADDANALTIVVSKDGGYALQIVLAKLQWTIRTLDRKIADLIRHHAPARVIAEAKALRASLRASADEIEKKIEENSETLAERAYPLQVDNEVASASLYRVLIEGLQYLITMSPGSSFEGESTSIQGRVTQIGRPEKGSTQFAKFYWNGALVHESFPRELKPGDHISFAYVSDGIRSNVTNQFKIDSFTIEKDKKKTKIELAGSLSLQQPVVADRVAPAWASEVSPQPGSYLKNSAAVSATVSDSLGNIDPASISIRLNGILKDGTLVEKDVTSSLNLISTDSYQSVQISGLLNNLDDGSYKLQLNAKDKAGNISTPSPFVTAFTIDNTAPLLSASSLDHIYTSNPNYEISLTVQDDSPTTTQILKGNLQILETAQKTISFQTQLIEGSNSFLLIAQDAAGNSSDPKTLDQIVLDTVPPVIAITTPDNQETNQKTFLLQYNIQETSPTVSKVLLNGTRVFTGGVGPQEVSLTLQEGINTIQVEASDAAGNEAVSAQLAKISLDSQAPVLSSLTPPNGTVVLTGTVTVSGSSNEEVSSASVNGQSLAISSDRKSFSGQIQASSAGLMSLIWSITDRVGNTTSVTTQLSVQEENTPPVDEGDGDAIENTSRGIVTLSGVSPGTFNPTNATMRFNLSGQTFNRNPQNTDLYINGSPISPNLITVESSVITVGAALEDGVNEVELRAKDSINAQIVFNETIVAGSHSLQLRTKDIVTGSSVSSAQIKVMLVSNSEVTLNASPSGDSVILTNLPKEDILISAITQDNRWGAVRAAGNSSSLDLRLVPLGEPSTINNSDFHQGLDGWKTFGESITGFVPHIASEATDDAAPDLDLSTTIGGTAILTRSITMSADKPNASTRFRIVVRNPADKFTVIQRSRSSGESTVRTYIGEDFGSSGTSSYLISSIRAAAPGDVIDTIYIVQSPNTAQAMNHLERALEWLTGVQSAIAAPLTSSLIPDYYRPLDLAIIGLQLADYDNLINNVKRPDAPPFCIRSEHLVKWPKASPLIRGISKAPIQSSHFGTGKNTICVNATVSGLAGDYIERLELVLSQNGVYVGTSEIRMITGSSTIGTLGRLNIFDQPINFSNVSLSALQTDPSRLEKATVFLRAYRPGSINPDAITDLGVDLPIAVNFPYKDDKHRYGNRDALRGGDDWALPHVSRNLEKLYDTGVGLLIGDISNMNLGTFKETHTTHTVGTDADVMTKNFNSNNKAIGPSRLSAEDGLKLLEIGENSSKIAKIYVKLPMPNPTGSDADSDPFWSRIRGECLPEGRAARSIFVYDIAHSDHFHLSYSESPTLSFQRSGSSLPAQEDFVLRHRSDDSTIIDFRRKNPSTQNELFAYTFYTLDDKFIASFDWTSDWNTIFTGTGESQYRCTKIAGTDGCIKLPVGDSDWRGNYKVKLTIFKSVPQKSYLENRDVYSCRSKTNVIRVRGITPCKPKDGGLHGEFGMYQNFVSSRYYNSLLVGGFVGENATVDVTTLVSFNAEVCENARAVNFSYLFDGVLRNSAQLSRSNVTYSTISGSARMIDTSLSKVDIDGRALMAGKVWDQNAVNHVVSEGGTSTSERTLRIRGNVSIYDSTLRIKGDILGSSSGIGVQLIQSTVYANPANGVISLSDNAQVYRSDLTSGLNGRDGPISIGGNATIDSMSHAFFGGVDSLIMEGDAYLFSSPLSGNSVRITSAGRVDRSGFISIGATNWVINTPLVSNVCDSRLVNNQCRPYNSTAEIGLIPNFVFPGPPPVPPTIPAVFPEVIDETNPNPIP